MTFEIDANENNAVVDRIKHEIRELRTKLLTHTPDDIRQITRLVQINS